MRKGILIQRTQASKIPQAAGQVKILIFLVKIEFFPIYSNNFCDAGQVPILKYFEAWDSI